MFMSSMEVDCEREGSVIGFVGEGLFRSQIGFVAAWTAES